jgi:hypothetical protein
VVGVLRKLEVVLKWECGNVFGGVVFFAAHVSFEVRDGSRVLFWHDVWCEELPLKLLFSELFTIGKDT